MKMTKAGTMPLAIATVIFSVCGYAAVGQERAGVRSAEALYSVSGQVVDALDGIFVVRSNGGGRTSIRFGGWPGSLPGAGSGVGIGDDVTAIGQLDRDVLDGGALDVLGIYVEDRRAYYVLGRATEGTSGVLTPLIMPSGSFTAVESPASLIGVITSIGEGELVFRAGDAEVGVETAALNYDPFDEIGNEPLRVGDLVMVEGVLARYPTEDARFLAESVTSIFVLGAAT